MSNYIEYNKLSEQIIKKPYACESNDSPYVLTDHDREIIQDVKVMVQDRNNDFWSRAIAIGVLRLLRETYKDI